MAVYFDSEGSPRCSHCSTSLRDREASGRCPSCNHWYTFSVERVEPGRLRLRALLAAIPEEVPRHWLMMRVLSTGSWVVGNALIVIVLGWLAWRQLARAFFW